MKIIIITILIVFSSSNLFSQNKYDFISACGIGFSFPTGNISENYNIGASASGDIGYMVNRIFGFNGSFTLNCFKLNSSNISKFPNYVSGGTFSFNIAKVNFIIGNMNPKDKINYYSFLGIGAAFISSDEITYTDLSTKNDKTISGAVVTTKFNLDFGFRAIINFHKNIGVFGEFESDLFNKIDVLPKYGIPLNGSSVVLARLGILFTF